MNWIVATTFSALRGDDGLNAVLAPITKQMLLNFGSEFDVASIKSQLASGVSFDQIKPEIDNQVRNKIQSELVPRFKKDCLLTVESFLKSVVTGRGYDEKIFRYEIFSDTPNFLPAHHSRMQRLFGYGTGLNFLKIKNFFDWFNYLTNYRFDFWKEEPRFGPQLLTGIPRDHPLRRELAEQAESVRPDVDYYEENPSFVYLVMRSVISTSDHESFLGLVNFNEQYIRSLYQLMNSGQVKLANYKNLPDVYADIPFRQISDGWHFYPSKAHDQASFRQNAFDLTLVGYKMRNCWRNLGTVEGDLGEHVGRDAASRLNRYLFDNDIYVYFESGEPIMFVEVNAQNEIIELKGKSNAMPKLKYYGQVQQLIRQKRLTVPEVAVQQDHEAEQADGPARTSSSLRVQGFDLHRINWDFQNEDDERRAVAPILGQIDQIQYEPEMANELPMETTKQDLLRYREKYMAFQTKLKTMKNKCEMIEELPAEYKEMPETKNFRVKCWLSRCQKDPQTWVPKIPRDLQKLPEFAQLIEANGGAGPVEKANPLMMVQDDPDALFQLPERLQSNPKFKKAREETLLLLEQIKANPSIFNTLDPKRQKAPKFMEAFEIGKRNQVAKPLSKGARTFYSKAISRSL